jgi:hypothetical protein
MELVSYLLNISSVCTGRGARGVRMFSDLQANLSTGGTSPSQTQIYLTLFYSVCFKVSFLLKEKE